MCNLFHVPGNIFFIFTSQLLALPASGEKIIFPLLDPMLHAYRPVLETLRGGNTTTSRNSGGGGEQRAAEVVGGEEAVLEQDKAGDGGISCPVSIIYGSPDHDWMPSR